MSSLRDLFVEAATEALRSASADQLDAIYIGNMSGGQFVGQEHLGPLMADHLGVAGIPAARVARVIGRLSGLAAVPCSDGSAEDRSKGGEQRQQEREGRESTAAESTDPITERSKATINSKLNSSGL